MSAASLPLLLRAMRLPTIAREHEAATHRAEAENWGYARFLSYLFEAEANERLQRKIQRQLKESNLPAGKTIESLDEKKSVVITSNLVFSQWDQIFKDPMTTMAAVDRLVHHATILEFTGDSIRANAAKQRQK